jgi:hypothetical protein
MPTFCLVFRASRLVQSTHFDLLSAISFILRESLIGFHADALNRIFHAGIENLVKRFRDCLERV